MDSTLATLVGHAFTATPPDQDDKTVTRILDAALQEAAASGLAGIQVEGVARRAGVNRVTIYRRLGDRDGLISALGAREGYRMSAALTEATASLTDPRERIVEGFLASLRYAARHPLVRRAARHEPESLIAVGLAEDAQLLRIAIEFLAAEIHRMQARGLALHLDPHQGAEVLARLFVSFVLLPRGPLDPADEAQMRDFADRTLVPMLTGSAAA